MKNTRELFKFISKKHYHVYPLHLSIRLFDFSTQSLLLLSFIFSALFGSHNLASCLVFGALWTREKWIFLSKALRREDSTIDIIFLFSHVFLIPIVILYGEYIGTTSISSVPVRIAHGLRRYLLIDLITTTLGRGGIDLVEVGWGAQLAWLFG